MSTQAEGRKSIGEWLYDTIGPITIEEGGKVYKTTGDGIVVEDAEGNKAEISVVDQEEEKKKTAWGWLTVGGLGILLANIFG